jgi:hypothetical protein
MPGGLKNALLKERREEQIIYRQIQRVLVNPYII